jgi:hypothetical protein
MPVFDASVARWYCISESLADNTLPLTAAFAILNADLCFGSHSKQPTDQLSVNAGFMGLSSAVNV